MVDGTDYGTSMVFVQTTVPELLTPHTMYRPAPVERATVEGHVVTAVLDTKYPACENAFTRVMLEDVTAALTLPDVPFVTVIPHPPVAAPQAFSELTVAMKFSKYGLLRNILALSVAKRSVRENTSLSDPLVYTFTRTQAYVVSEITDGMT